MEEIRELFMLAVSDPVLRIFLGIGITIALVRFVDSVSDKMLGEQTPNKQWLENEVDYIVQHYKNLIEEQSTKIKQLEGARKEDEELENATRNLSTDLGLDDDHAG